MRSKNIDSISLDVAFYFNTIGGFPIEIETKTSKLITYSHLACNKLVSLRFIFHRKSTYTFAGKKEFQLHINLNTFQKIFQSDLEVS